jgi:hypothetical protein
VHLVRPQRQHLAGRRVLAPAAETWRAALAGGATAADRAVAIAIRMRIPTWPQRSSVHARDAAGVALYAAITVQMAELAPGAQTGRPR